jgi:hypothetical protein
MLYEKALKFMVTTVNFPHDDFSLASFFFIGIIELCLGSLISFTACQRYYILMNFNFLRALPLFSSLIELEKNFSQLFPQQSGKCRLTYRDFNASLKRENFFIHIFTLLNYQVLKENE